jgi:hypothetical protein
MTIKTALFRIIFVWVFALAWTLMPMFGWNRYVSEFSGNVISSLTVSSRLLPGFFSVEQKI